MLEDFTEIHGNLELIASKLSNIEDALDRIDETLRQANTLKMIDIIRTHGGYDRKLDSGAIVYDFTGEKFAIKGFYVEGYRHITKDE